MTGITLPASKARTRSTKRLRLTDRLARGVLLRQLDAMRSGTVRLSDPIGTVELGAGRSPSVQLQINDTRLYRRLLSGGSLAAAEAYIDGWWDVDDLVSFMSMFANEIHRAHSLGSRARAARSLGTRLKHLARRNNIAGSRRNITEHYDLGNDFFRLMLDPTMTYSGGVFLSPDTSLEESQIEKLDRICRKLRLTHNDHILEIGTGWGSFALHAAREYGCRVTTTTLSKNQHAHASEIVEQAGLSDRIDLLTTDYRQLEGTYDAIVSIEMVEAVGNAYLPTYFKACRERLKPDGQMALQAISMPDAGYSEYLRRADFIQRYVFPGSCCPSVGAINRAASGAGLKLTHLEDITPHYAETLSRWRDRFHENIEAVKELGYSDRFIRLWEYYLSYCEAGFSARYISTSQLLLSNTEFRGESLPGIASANKPAAR